MEKKIYNQPVIEVTNIALSMPLLGSPNIDLEGQNAIIPD